MLKGNEQRLAWQLESRICFMHLYIQIYPNIRVMHKQSDRVLKGLGKIGEVLGLDVRGFAGPSLLSGMCAFVIRYVCLCYQVCVPLLSGMCAMAEVKNHMNMMVPM